MSGKKNFRLFLNHKKIIFKITILFVIVLLILQLTFRNQHDDLLGLNKVKYEDLSHNRIRDSEHCHITELEIWSTQIKNLLSKKPVYDKCKHHSPLTFISGNRLYINATVKKNFYQDNIENCQMAPVLRETSKVDYFAIGK